ncbi:hypothetical protein [Cupriavidus sp. RAF12]|uniref:hypothetical protein n=1 Tax=Cupriavidus sp. RAF12 TaxID=3233050 RepID=UPI003F8E5622
MSTNQFQTTKIALITDDLTNVELIEEAREKLPQQEDKYPGVAAFASMKVTPYSSTDKAHTKLFSDPQACAELQLIVLDGTVRKESTVGTSGNSAAAMSLLDWLTANIPDVPVIVLASTRVEGLDLRQSRRARKNILALDIANLDINMDLGRALHGALNSESLDELHVTLRIGEYTARHSTMSGGIELKGDDYIYRNLQDIHQLVDTVNDFSPMINGEPTFDWQTKLRELGNNVYDSLIAGTIGKHIAKHYKLENQQAPVDLRVEIDVAPNETAQLYGLPFELARPPEYHDKYLCTCIPMARRIHFVKGLKRLAHEEDPEGCDVIEEVASDEDEEDHRSLSPNDELATLDRPLRLLFINASFEGSALVRRDSPPYKI